jgi:hypothetical protein
MGEKHKIAGTLEAITPIANRTANWASSDKTEVLLVAAEAGNRATTRNSNAATVTPTPSTRRSPATYSIDLSVDDHLNVYPVKSRDPYEFRFALKAIVISNQEYINDGQELRLRFRAVDARGKQFGSIYKFDNDDGILKISKYSANFRATYYAPSRSGVVMLWAELVDSQNRVRVKSKTHRMEFRDIKAWHEYGPWEPSGKANEWKRKVYAFAGLRSDSNTEVKAGVKVQARLLTPSKYSWLENSLGTTGTAHYTGSSEPILAFIQHARWAPESPFQLNTHKVVVEVAK